MKLELTQTLSQEQKGEGAVEMRQTLTPQQWYAMHMSQYYALQREAKELRREESEKYVRALRSLDPGIGHFVHSVHG